MTDTNQPTTIAYGDLDDQIADVVLPAGEPSGLLLLVLHGGDWQHAADRTYLSGFVSALAGLGHAVANVEYRRLGGGGGWPTTFDDVGAALERVTPAVAEIAATAGITLNATVLVGHSAGGHLALWVASQPIATTPPLVLAIGIGPTADLALAHELGATDGAVAALLGGAPSEVPDVVAQASPVHLTPTVPVRLVHADQDPIVPIALAKSYVEAAGGDATLVELSGNDHFTGTIPGGLGWDELLAMLREAQGLAPAAQR